MSSNSLTKIIALLIGLNSCSDGDVSETAQLPESFSTMDANSSLLFDDLQLAKRKLHDLTGRNYNGGFIDIDGDNIDDPYIVVNGSTTYSTISSVPPHYTKYGKERIWSKIHTDVIERAKKRELKRQREENKAPYPFEMRENRRQQRTYQI